MSCNHFSVYIGGG